MGDGAWAAAELTSLRGGGAGKAVRDVAARGEKRGGGFRPGRGASLPSVYRRLGDEFPGRLRIVLLPPSPDLFLHVPGDATGRLRLERALFPVTPLSRDLDNHSITALGCGETVLGAPFTALPPWVHPADEIKVKPQLHVGGPSQPPPQTHPLGGRPALPC